MQYHVLVYTEGKSAMNAEPKFITFNNTSKAIVLNGYYNLRHFLEALRHFLETSFLEAYCGLK